MTSISNRQSNIAGKFAQLKESTKHVLETKNRIYRKVRRENRNVRKELKKLNSNYKDIRKALNKKNFTQISKLLNEENSQLKITINNLTDIISSENALLTRSLNDAAKLIRDIEIKDSNLSNDDINEIENILRYLKEISIKTVNITRAMFNEAQNNLKTSETLDSNLSIIKNKKIQEEKNIENEFRKVA